MSLSNKITELDIMASKAEEIGRDISASRLQSELKSIRRYEVDINTTFKELEVIKVEKCLETVEMDVNELRKKCLTFMESVNNLKK